MDWTRYTAIAHVTHAFCNPVGTATLDRFVESLALAPGERVLDAGCGKGELLIRVVARWNARGVGVDVHAGFLAVARERAAARGLAIEWIESPLLETAFAPASFDLAMCVGSAHAFGETLPEALTALRGLVKPGGAILLGHGHWMREPHPEYLASFGGTHDELASLADTRAAIERAGLRVEDCAPTSLEEWDAYEIPYAENVERFFAEHPDDPDRDAFLARSRAWRASYERWGRGTMGFALWRLRRPA